MWTIATAFNVQMEACMQRPTCHGTGEGNNDHLAMMVTSRHRQHRTQTIFQRDLPTPF